MNHPTHRALPRTVAALFAIVTVALASGAVQAQEADGELIKNIVVNTPTLDDITNVTVFEPTAITPTGLAFNDPIDPQFTGDLDAILAANSLTRFDVFDVLFDRMFDGQTAVSESEVSVTQTSGTVFIGDPDEPCLITVITGTVTVTDTTTLTTTNFYTDTLTVQLFTDAVPNAVPAPGAVAGGLALLTLAATRRRRGTR